MTTNTKKILKVFIIFFVLLIFFIPITIAIKYATISQIFTHFVNSLTNLTGFNTYLVEALVALLFIPFTIGIRYTISIRKKRRIIGSTILTTLFVIYNIILFVVTKDLYFSFSEGKVLKWYALTPDGVKFFDKPGIEPVYGITLKPVTPNVVRNLELLKKGEFKPIDPSNVNFFNPITGEAQVWYYEYSDSSFDFFDKPGFHPLTGTLLKPVNENIYLKWKAISLRRNKIIKEISDDIVQKEVIKSDEHIKSVSDNIVRKEVIKSNEPTKKDIINRNELENKFVNLTNKNISIIPDKNNVVVSIITLNNQLNISPDRILIDLFNASEVNKIINFFNEPFYSKKYFDNIFNGNTHILKQLNLNPEIDYFIFGKIEFSFRKDTPDYPDLYSCDVNFSYIVVNKVFNTVDGNSLSVIGPGFNKESSLMRGLEILAENYSNKILVH